MVGGQAQTTATKGRHSELLAQTALLANGWTVLEPITTEPFDLAITRKGENRIIRVQVKTINYRVKDGYEYYVVKGKKNNGVVYSTDECEIFIGVYENTVYMLDNRGLGEYWCTVADAATKWTELPTGLETLRTTESEAV